MLNGIDPIIIFGFKKLPPSVAANPSVPTAGSGGLPFDLPFIPIYLSEKLTGIYIDSEDKNLDVDTTVMATTDGSTPLLLQRPISSTVTINMKASRDSIGVALFSALSDLVFPKLTSKEYNITYLHGAVTVFQGLLHSFTITQNSNDDLYNITMGLVKPPADLKSPVPVVGRVTGATPL